VPERPLPAWSLPAGTAEALALPTQWPGRVTREWAWGGSTGKGVSVCILDSGIERDHPMVGELAASVAVEVGDDEEITVVDDAEGDLCGHGTACAGIVRSLAPDCALTSVRVLGARGRGASPLLMAGLRWAIAQGFDVINLSLSTTRRETAAVLHELADDAYFRGTLLVAAANNAPVESFPWRFSSVISVGSHDGSDPFQIYYNPAPPAEFFARGVSVEVPWRGGVRMTVTGNSFAAAFVTGLCALIRAKHRDLTPFQVKAALHLLADNVRVAHEQR
jgi:subtilisin